ncbi:zf-HC2 domain-containing protein [Corynebacterium sanguinis]|uniref:Zf-HC2 domain-containing protein n=1 Tax=Corynebacterium sanguinis TaxID=2594913 RepID=A0A838WUK2_9CORY|nr:MULTISPECIES: zf-HC2 domain-containing protein [Corynebacterium]MBA4505434.1 zf-HC2 domain-containing protein [Corynebacterium sanguinis]MCT1411737.1 zf-HC2 domain-containing protein [Corynebacterium sanguinis]MCT1413675.1 zf-HC2 domain-containing protein [Corynebacterium sanguinis]MCT1425327.1 zf-HC2 domain-containing protein [Corynebacterium sanguinis]MCT1444267.1 zf-HC2 domain-containing protein [Corynebacterium sanguinis]
MLSHDQVRAALSARVDGESSGLDDAVVDAHVAECAECSAYYQRILSLSRNLRFAEIGGGMAPPENLSTVILAGVEGEWRKLSQRRMVLLTLCRVALVAAALVWLAWAVMHLVNGGESGTASVRLGVATALAYTAARPAQIPGIALVVGTMFTFTLGFVVRDAVLDTGSGVAPHVLILLPTLIALLGTLAVDRGPQLRRAWRSLGADPT